MCKKCAYKLTSYELYKSIIKKQLYNLYTNSQALLLLLLNLYKFNNYKESWKTPAVTCKKTVLYTYST